MFRSLLVAALVAVVFVPFAVAEEPKKEPVKPTVNIFASNNDATLAKQSPENGVIASAKAWDKLVKVWDVKGAPKVDFDKEILIVATTVGSRISVTPKLDDKGDLKIAAIATADFGEGFRYVIKSVSKDGVKTVNGKTLPKE